MIAAGHIKSTLIQFLKFGVIGLGGFMVDYGFFHLALYHLGFGHYGSAFFSYPFALLFTWVGNRFFTFRGQGAGSAHVQLMRFFVVCLLGLAFNRGMYSLLVTLVPLCYDYPILALMAGTGTGMVSNFFLSRRLVFR